MEYQLVSEANAGEESGTGGQMTGVQHHSQASSPTLQQVSLAPTLTLLFSGVHTVAKRNRQLLWVAPAPGSNHSTAVCYP